RRLFIDPGPLTITLMLNLSLITPNLSNGSRPIDLTARFLGVLVLLGPAQRTEIMIWTLAEAGGRNNLNEVSQVARAVQQASR
ncbi:hypothetical protein, partial [Hyphomicrobium sp.]|uniref:hypothetical protein n=1 Tax=Hyphomicrobium sp. TaxID=82 RepID=UPI002FDE003D